MKISSIAAPVAAVVAATMAVSRAVDASALSSSSTCSFCAVDEAGLSHTFDLSNVSSSIFLLNDAKTGEPDEYSVTTPCGNAGLDKYTCAPPSSDPALQSCRGLGTLAGKNASVQLTSTGFNITMLGGSNDPPCGATGYRSLVYQFICDKDAPVDGGPDQAGVLESPGCNYVVTWRHPSACDPVPAGSHAECGPLPPAPTPAPWVDTRTPKWKPTWDMMRSTVLYTCNNTGMHDVSHAVKFGLVVYDWSNAKALWANAHPMNSEELLTKQAEMVLAADPGIPGEQPRVWVYRNTIKALNWYTSVREKLDDPAYAGWFVKFKDYKGPESNNSYHVPACDWYGNATSPPKCSGFYHDQEQTPEHAGGGSAYPVDGQCMEQCDCGATNPCGEYIFDHRNASFGDWFVNEYMISAETLLHKPIPIGLGWLDDSMQLIGPTEENPFFINDTGSTPQDMANHVQAYQKNMYRLAQTVVAQGGFWWQLVHGHGPAISEFGGNGAHGHVIPRQVSTEQCAEILRTQYCTATPPAWEEAAFYEVRPEVAISNATDLTAEFLVSRGPYAWLGYGWVGCTNGDEARPRPAEWDVDYGVPSGPCQETATNSSVFSRTYSNATVVWDCNSGHGRIEMKEA